MTRSSPEFKREPSHRCGVTLMESQRGRAVADAMSGKPGVSVARLPSMIRIDAKHSLEFEFDELAEATGEAFDQACFEEILTTHYGRMVALDDSILLFADPEDAADYLGLDLYTPWD
jgi:propane monooxygenase coupling protein